MKTLIRSLFVLFLITVVVAPSVIAEESGRVVTFRGRDIDLKPYIEGFPYRTFRPFYSAGKLYYYHRDYHFYPYYP